MLKIKLLQVFKILSSDTFLCFREVNLLVLVLIPLHFKCLFSIDTGSRDGQIILWENVTKTVREEARIKEQEIIRRDQRLNNYLINGKLSKALKLSLKMNKPRLTKRTLYALQKRGEMESALHKLSLDERNILFQSLAQWNTFAAQSSIVQDILKYLITETLASGQTVAAEKCAGLIAYSEKHYQRLDKLQSRLAVVDLLLDVM